MMTVLDEQGTPWRNKMEMDEEDDAKEYVATAGAISSIANGSRKNHFSLSVSDITISIVPRSVYDLSLALRPWKY